MVQLTKEQEIIVYEMIKRSKVVSKALDMHGNPGADCHIEVDDCRWKQIADKVGVSLEDLNVYLDKTYFKK